MMSSWGTSRARRGTWRWEHATPPKRTYPAAVGAMPTIVSSSVVAGAAPPDDGDHLARRDRERGVEQREPRVDLPGTAGRAGRRRADARRAGRGGGGGAGPPVESPSVVVELVMVPPDRLDSTIGRSE